MKRFNWGLVLAFLLCIIFWFCVVCLVTCKPTSLVSTGRLVIASVGAASYADGTVYVYGRVENEGADPVYNGLLITVVNGGEAEFEYFLGDFQAGEEKDFFCDLEGYTNPDEVNVTFRLSWDHKKLLACVDMDSARVSGGD